MRYDIEFGKWVREHPTDVSAIGINALLDEIDRLTVEVEKHRWISVKERLPETYETDDVFGYRHSKVCNVIGKDRCRWMAYYDQDENQWCTLPTGVYLGIDYVTHWMPIPEPPKEEEC